jgi:hypothetical protein
VFLDISKSLDKEFIMKRHFLQVSKETLNRMALISGKMFDWINPRQVLMNMIEKIILFDS